MVDNDKANLWYRKAGTPATKKDIETLPKAYHQIHKEPDDKDDMLEHSYKFIAKIMSQQGGAQNWKGMKDFQVGRTGKQKNFPFKKVLLGALVFAYLLFGLLVYIGTRLFSSQKHAYRFATVVFRWPRAFFKIFSVLRTNGSAKTAADIIKLTNQK